MSKKHKSAGGCNQAAAAVASARSQRAPLALVERPAPFAPSAQRVWLSLEAVCQIDALAGVLAERAARDSDCAALAMVVRIGELASAAIAALGDESDDEDRVHAAVFLHPPRRLEADSEAKTIGDAQ